MSLSVRAERRRRITPKKETDREKENKKKKSFVEWQETSQMDEMCG